ncbi:predicted protein [Uncinocarpus reesii 1704]|uniref:Uncharacterized protein n=1 Tax=Uncinocarpus reesii (strain UAMH 1704) TaxID=336963 RepID=C4JSA2_UNCRE|nr:uncharacterized protein UREG_05341 [Uncinocarpus reesii 1704]EEP80499.1 predicted protein [Uncinocarpus reesii 1704]
MDQVPRAQQSRFASLAVEIRQAILCEIPDIASLNNAVKADESLQSAFSNYESPILDKILNSTLSPELLPEVFAVLESSHLDPWSEERVNEILDRYVERKPTPIRWTLADAQIVGDLHYHIQFFIDDFVSWALSAHPLPNGEIHAPLSSTERFRIEAAFYRFELFCNLFRERNDKNYEIRRERSEQFSEDFAFWEAEQLGCILDYLVDKISPAFNDVARHDILWGEFCVPFDDFDLHPEPHKAFFVWSKLRLPFVMS